MSIKNMMIRADKATKVSFFKTLYWLSTAAVLLSCSANDNKTQDLAIGLDSPWVVSRKEPANYDEFDYSLPQSSYHLKVKITGINTKISKKAFVTKTDQYSVPQKSDGYFLTLHFSITSPYDHELMVPVPGYFYITSENSDIAYASTTRHKQCHCEVDNSTEVTTSKGKMLYQISEGKCGYDNYCIKFKANETKEFKIKFTDAVLGSVRKLAFNGFNMSWANPDYSVKQDKGLVIDVDSRKIVGEKLF